jgi:hypothetical protein
VTACPNVRVGVPLESYNPRTCRFTPTSYYSPWDRLLLDLAIGCEPALMDTFEFFEWLNIATISELEFFGAGPGLRTIEDISRF